MRIGVVSLGCDKNRVDTEKMLSRLISAGHTFARTEEEAISLSSIHVPL